MSQAGQVVWSLDIDDSKFTAKLNKASREMQSSATQTEKHVSNSWLRTGAVMGAVAGATSAVFSKAMTSITNSIDGAIKRVDILNNFPKIMSNMGIGADESKTVIKDLSKQLQGLPTPLDQAALSVQRLTATTGDVTKSKDIFLALNNAILAGGAPMDLQSTAMEQFSQAFAKGRIDMVEWRSIMSAMPAQLMQVAQAMGLPNADALGEGLRNGTISMTDFANTLTKLNSEGTGQFQSFAQQAKNSTGGIQTGFANMQTAITRGLANIMQTIGQENISQAITAIGTGFEFVLTNVAKLVTYLVTTGASVANWIRNNQTLVRNLAIVIGTLLLPQIIMIGWHATIAFAKYLIGLGITVAQTAIAAVSMAASWLLAMGPIGLIVAAVIALGLLIIANWETVKGWLSSFWEWLKGVFNGGIDWIKRNWLLLVTILAGPIGLAVGLIIKHFDAIKRTVQTVWNWITGIFSTIGEIGSGIIRGAVNAVIGFAERTINGFIRIVNGAIGALNKVPGVNIGKIGEVNIPKLAEGGIVNKATLAMIGEGNEPEAVIPLSKLGQMLNNQGAGGGVTNHIGTINISSEVDGERWLQRLSRETDITSLGLVGQTNV